MANFIQSYWPIVGTMTVLLLPYILGQLRTVIALARIEEKLQHVVDDVEEMKEIKSDIVHLKERVAKLEPR